MPFESPAEPSRGKDRPRQAEPERRDVPPERTSYKQAASEYVPGVGAERAARPRSEDAIGGKPGAPLELHQGASRRRPGDSVNRSAVDAAGAKRNLERCDVGRGSRLSFGGRKWRAQDDERPAEDEDERVTEAFLPHHVCQLLAQPSSVNPLWPRSWPNRTAAGSPRPGQTYQT